MAIPPLQSAESEARFVRIRPALANCSVVSGQLVCAEKKVRVSRTGDGGGAWSQAVGVVSSFRVYPCRIEVEEMERTSDDTFCRHTRHLPASVAERSEAGKQIGREL